MGLSGVWGGQALVCDPCSCYGDSCSNLAAWPNEETLSPWDKGGRVEVYRGGPSWQGLVAYPGRRGPGLTRKTREMICSIRFVFEGIREETLAS